jgi:2-iminoacetate synthase
VTRFSEVFASRHNELEALAATAEPGRSLEDIFVAAERGGLSTEDAASLLAWGRDPARRAEIEAAARAVREHVSGTTVEFVIPVYVTSFCQNDCLYCGYRKGNSLAERIRLSLDDFERQLDLILSWGHRQIELVLSDDPEFGPPVLARYLQLTRRKLDEVGGGVIAACAPVYEVADYTLLREAGLEWVVEWQETYHRPHFERWHFPGSPKRFYESRLDLWDRTIAAGLPRIGMGVLLGLYDWRFDVLAVVEHGNYLRRTYQLEPHAIGIPRLKPARGVLASQKPSRFTVSDDDYRFLVSVYHLAFPRSRLFFNTRESYEMNIGLVAGGDIFTVDCETLPGGYLRTHLPGQFSTHYFPSRREVVRALGQRGLTYRYLAAETPPPAWRTAALAPAAAGEWAEAFDQLRDRLTDWEKALQGLRAEAPAGRPEAAAAMRRELDCLKTVAIDHCRQAENGLAITAGETPERKAQFESLRRYHERFGVDLDKFERQIASFELSGVPTVLLSVGSRIVREFRSHLKEEEELASALLARNRA